MFHVRNPTGWSRCLLPLCLWLCCWAEPPWERYLSPDLSFGIYHPRGWEVTVEEGGVRVSDPRSGASASLVSLAAGPSDDSLRLAQRSLARARQQNPQLQLDWARTTADRRRTVVETHDRQWRGRAFFCLDAGTARIWSYRIPTAQFARLQPCMLTIFANLTWLNPQLAQAARQRTTLHQLPLHPQRLADGSASMQVPAGWSLHGSQGSTLCLSPDQACGFCFGTANFWGPSRIPYFDNSTLPGLHYAPMAPVDALAVAMGQLGTRSIQAEQRMSNPNRAGEASLAVRREAQSESATLCYVTAKGVATRGYFETLAFAPLPSGQWFILYWGVWAPQTDFDAWLPTLVPAAASFRIDEQWAASYIQQGLEHLREQMARTRAAMADTARYARETNLAIFEEKMRSGDYIDYKRTATIRGEQEWVSEVEGGALYKSDHWGLSREGQPMLEGQDYNYNNFQGQNPVYRENLTPVDASREVYERVFRTRP